MDNFPLHISILGGGNVATHLVKEFARHPEIKLVQIYNRSLDKIVDLERFAPITDDVSKLKKADIFIIAVSDDAIIQLANKIPFKKALVVHTSGSTPMQALPNKRKGVFYPFQTFSKQKKVDFKKIPILLEADNKKDLELLKGLAKLFSDEVQEVHSSQRKALHIAGVFVSNFVNHLYVQADRLLKEHQLSFDLLKPLILEVAEKVQTLPPEMAQTGPAVRGDYKVVNKHLESLKNPEQRKIYKLMSEAINHKIDLNDDADKLMEK